jgi:hypothetical protein
MQESSNRRGQHSVIESHRQDTETTRAAVEMKVLIEQMREQGSEHTESIRTGKGPSRGLAPRISP